MFSFLRKGKRPGAYKGRGVDGKPKNKLLTSVDSQQPRLKGGHLSGGNWPHSHSLSDLTDDSEDPKVFPEVIQHLVSLTLLCLPCFSPGSSLTPVERDRISEGLTSLCKKAFICDLGSLGAGTTVDHG